MKEPKKYDVRSKQLTNNEFGLNSQEQAFNIPLQHLMIDVRLHPVSSLASDVLLYTFL